MSPQNLTHSGCVVDNGMECDCSCHTSEHVMHMMACCSKCEYCGQNISRGHEKRHAETHKANNEEKL